MPATNPQSVELITVISSVLSSSVISVILTSFFNNKFYIKSKSHENKIIEIKNFYRSYQTFKLGLENYHSHTMHNLKDQETTYSIANNLIPLFIDFQYQCMVIKLFLGKEDYKKVIEVEQILSKDKIDIDKFNVSFYNSDHSDDGRRMFEIYEKDFKETLPELMKGIELSLRKSFK